MIYLSLTFYLSLSLSLLFFHLCLFWQIMWATCTQTWHKSALQEQTENYIASIQSCVSLTCHWFLTAKEQATGLVNLQIQGSFSHSDNTISYRIQAKLNTHLLFLDHKKNKK